MERKVISSTLRDAEGYFFPSGREGSPACGGKEGLQAPTSLPEAPGAGREQRWATPG